MCLVVSDNNAFELPQEVFFPQEIAVPAHSLNQYLPLLPESSSPLLAQRVTPLNRASIDKPQGISPLSMSQEVVRASIELMSTTRCGTPIEIVEPLDEVVQASMEIKSTTCTETLSETAEPLNSQKISACRDISELMKVCKGQLIDLTTLVAIFEKVTVLVSVNGQFDSAQANTIKKSNFFKAILAVAEENIQEFSSKDFVRVVYSLAKLTVVDLSFKSSLVKLVEERVSCFDESEIADLGWALCMLKGLKKALLHVFQEKLSEDKIKNLPAQKISDFVWVCSELDDGSSRWIENIKEILPCKIKEFTPYELISLCESFTKIQGIKGNSTLIFLMKRMVETAEDIEPHYLSNLASLLSKKMLNDRSSEQTECFTLLSKCIENKIKSFVINDLITLTRSFARAAFLNENLMKACSERAQLDMNQLDFSMLCETAHSFALLNVPDIQLFKAIATKALTMTDSFDSHGMSHLMWSFAVFDYGTKEFYEKLSHKAQLMMFTVAELSQLNSVYLLLRLTNKIASIPKLLKIQMDAKRKKLKQEYAVSESEREFFKLLSTFKKGGKQSFRLEGFCLDVAFQNEMIGFEFDGPYHFASNTHHLLGNNLIKNKIMRLLGWTLIRIPHFEWAKCLNREAKIAYLRKKCYQRI